MKCVNETLLQTRLAEITADFNLHEPFRYTVIDHFLLPEVADSVLAQYPSPDSEVWNSTTYINQKNKLQKAQLQPDTLIHQVFAELNSPELIGYLNHITGIGPLLTDPSLFGAGLHQSLKGAFLDVHVDFNRHPDQPLFRRLNLLIFLNKNWKREYEGYLELWDMSRKACLEKIAPDFNRCVIFETNEVSFHGHPAPLNTPAGVTRKSLAVYYYTADAPETMQTAQAHNTIFRNTEGLRGYFKNLLSGLKALTERLR